MNQARGDLAARQAESIRQDMIAQGKETPQAVVAAYMSGQVAHQRHQLDELRRLREEGFLSVMLQVEKSAMPFPDEPGVTFPTPAIIRSLTRDKFDNWADFSKYRTERYAIQTFGAPMPPEAYQLRDKLAKTFPFAGFDDPRTTLAEAIDLIQKRHDVVIEVNERAFRFDQVNEVLKTEIAAPTPILPMPRATLGTVLKKVLARIPAPSGATFLIRRATIELTTGQFALAEKTTRVYPVAELVTPIATPAPSSSNKC